MDNTPTTGNVIGSRMTGVRRKRAKTELNKDEDEGYHSPEYEVTVAGLAISWDKLNAFYISLSNNKSMGNNIRPILMNTIP